MTILSVFCDRRLRPRFLNYLFKRYLLPLVWRRSFSHFAELASAAKSVRSRTRSGPRVLMATGTGGNWPCSAFEGVLGASLSLRGADVSFLLCDGVLPACQECDTQWLSESSIRSRGPETLCNGCYGPASRMLEPLGLPVLRYSQFLGGDGVEKNTQLYDQHAFAGALRYFARGTLPQRESASEILSRFQHATAMTGTVIRRLLADWRPDVVVFHHGMYVPQGVVGAVLREAGVRVVNWGPAYRKGTVLFSHGDTYHHTMIDEPTSVWEGMAWSHDHEARVMGYLKSRWTGANDWINFQGGAERDFRAIAQRIGLDLRKPIVGLLTNVIWDAQLHFSQSAFPSMLDWLFASIDYFKTRTDVQWIVRVHPAEVLGSVPSRQRVEAEIFMRFGNLPPHIKLIGPEERVSTYALMEMCNAALVYGTKTALELACTGLPVIVAGEAWCRGKGFTLDASSQWEYRQLLEALPLARRLSDEQITAARKYAYHFFFRRMIQVKALKHTRRFGPYKVRVDSLGDLAPGSDPGLDVICEGILNGTPFTHQT